MALEASYYSIKPIEDTSNTIELSYSRQGLTSLPNDLNKRIENDKVTRLDLSRNQLTTLPQLTSNTTTLQVIDLTKNSFTELPLEICSLKSLKGLILKCNNIKSLPHEMTQLTQLEEINLSGNCFEQFPLPLLSLSRLSFLHLGGNAIQHIPKEINKLSQLTYLYLGGNRLQHVPPELGQLNKLVALILSGNQLQSLPTQLKGLTELKSLHLHDNQLQTLPQNIVRIKNLQELSLRNNPLVLRFIREYSDTIPTLLELAGQAVKHHSLHYDSLIIPETLIDFLSRARKCDNPTCSGVYFTSRSRRVTFVDFCGRYRVPLMQYLCSDHCQGGEDHVVNSSSSEDESDEMSAISREKIKKVLLG